MSLAWCIEMSVPATEEANESYAGIDRWPSERILSAIVAAQTQAIAVIADAVPALAVAGEAVADRMRRGGRLIYAGAGSSGLLAQVDALELPCTYGIEAEQIPVMLAGGNDALLVIPSGAEDDLDEAAQSVEQLNVRPLDSLLAVSASGRTPYTLAAMRAAKARGALTIGMACNANTPILENADHAVLLATPAEVIAGSTRMNAGTAQKCALNMLSTLIGIRLGHVFDGMMVNVRPENSKLKRRAAQMVARACGFSDEAKAADLLDRAGNEVKTAITLYRLPGGTADDARVILAAHGGDLRSALEAMAASQTSTR
jgi:N-acetylmuramic acid 6-phosphate etherase